MRFIVCEVYSKFIHGMLEPAVRYPRVHAMRKLFEIPHNSVISDLFLVLW